MSDEKTVLYSIECRTGCTCCRYENHTRGLYGSFEEAERRRDKFRSMPLLASQYSKTGMYSINSHETEKLPDGRLIIDGKRVIQAEQVISVNEDGNIEGDDQLGDESWPR